MVPELADKSTVMKGHSKGIWFIAAPGLCTGRAPESRNKGADVNSKAVPPRPTQARSEERSLMLWWLLSIPT